MDSNSIGLPFPQVPTLNVPAVPTINPLVHAKCTLWGICFVQPPAQPFTPFFGFATFITALALIAVIFTISDTRYRFRIQTAPLPLISISFWSASTIGALVLTSDIYFSERWPIPTFFPSQTLWQGMLGGVFLILVIVWFYFAFLRPATFGHWNAARYAGVIFRAVVRGDDAELRVIADELYLSAGKIVDLCATTEPAAHEKPPKAAGYAHDLLLLIGNRKLCKQVAGSAPGTAIELFRQMSEKKKYNLPIRQFSTNVSSEAIQNTDSILYHEDEGYSSGLLGYIKPFSVAIYGDYQLVERLGQANGSPLDVNYGAVHGWNALQLEAYCRVVLVTYKNYLHTGAWRTHSFALARAFDNVENGFSDAYKLNDPQTPYFPSDVLSRLDAAVHFMRDVVNEVGKLRPLPTVPRLRVRKRHGAPRSHDFYDQIADLMFHLVRAASYATADQDRSWSIQYVAVWSNFTTFTSREGVWPIVLFKLRRLIFDAITDMPFFDYQSARIFGFALNVMGFKERQGQSPFERPLQKALLAWTKKNFLKRWEENPDVAVSGLPAGLAYDAHLKCFVKTYAKGLSREAPKAYFDLTE
jgi:hypothetical protein